MSNPPLISIVSVNFNGLIDTLELLASVERYLPLDKIEVLIVDNGSAQDEAVKISKQFPWVTTIRSEVNIGFAGGNNLGIAKSRGEFILFLNNDTLLIDNSLLLLPAVFKQEHSIAMVSPKIMFHTPKGVVQYAGMTPLSKITLRNRIIGYGEPDSKQFNKEGECGYPHGAAMMLPRSVIDEVGTMPELYFLYWEELDWSEMFKQKGYSVWYAPQSVVLHKEGSSVGKNSFAKQYYMVRNRLLFAKRNRVGFTKFISFIYLFLIVLPKEATIHLLNKELSLVAATIRGYNDFCRARFGKLIRSNK